MLTRIDRETIVRGLHAKGMKDCEISEDSGMPMGTIWHIRRRLGLRANGVAPIGAPSRTSDEDILLWMAEGLSRAQMAERSGLKASTIKSRVQKIRGVKGAAATASRNVRQIDRFLSAFRDGCYAPPAHSRMAETSNRDGNRIIGLPAAVCTASSLYGA